MIANVIGSLIAVGIGAGLFYSWNRILIPWYQSITYQGPLLAGTWGFSYDGNGVTDDQIVEAEQHGKNVKGIHTIHRWKDGSAANIRIPFTGQVFGHLVLLSGLDSTTGTLGSQLLDILDGAKRLKGSVITIEPETGKIASYAREWVRK